MSTAADADDVAIQSALIFAALSGPFDPKQALKELAPPNELGRLLFAATRLSNVCDTRPAGAEGRWLMRTPVRHSLLQAMTEVELSIAVASRRAAGFLDVETLDILGLIQNKDPLDSAQIESIISDRSDLAALERLIVALDRIGSLAPTGLLQRARFALADFNRAAKYQHVGERGFFGREDELGEINTWLSEQNRSGPAKCLYFSGAPGVGKSSLLAEAVRLYDIQWHPIILRLDFDRAGLDVLDQTGLTMEATRQIAEQLGDQTLVKERLEAGRADGRSRIRTTVRQRFPERLAQYLGSAVASQGRPVLVILDTLEVLRGRGDSHPKMLFDWLDRLVESGVRPMSVLGAGRGHALDVLRLIPPRRIDRGNEPARYRELPLAGLDRPAARDLLRKLDVPDYKHGDLFLISEGNPLKLRLAATLAKQPGGWEQLSKRKGREELSGAFLYRLLLSRIDDPELARLANPGLIVRRISAELIRDVLAPTLGLRNVDLTKANDLLQRLATHHWLVEEDVGAPGFLKHRSDMRTLLLPLLYTSNPKLSARIDARAVRWFAAIAKDWAQVEAVYHQLQLTRMGGKIPTVPLHIAAQVDDEMLAELPQQAADKVRATRGERTSLFRNELPSGGQRLDDGLISREVLSFLERQDWIEGSQFVRNILDYGGLDVRSLAADAIRAFLWHSGQWSRARDLLTERDLFGDSDHDLEKLPPPFALARLEMRAELDPDGLRKAIQAERPKLTWLDQASLAAKDNIARQGSLAHILKEAETFFFSADSLEEGDVVSTTQAYWVGPNRDDHDVRLITGRAIERMRLSGLEGGTDVSFGRVIAALTPYNSILEVLSVASRSNLSKLAKSVSDRAVNSEGTMFGESWRSLDRESRSEGIQFLTNLGVVAEWADVVAFIRGDVNLRLIARSAERWRRTVAGDWAFGRRRGEWRKLALLDETTHWRLQYFLREPAGVDRAFEQIRVWQEALDSPPLEELVLRRFPRTLSEARLVSPTEASVELIIRQLLVRGVPAVIAPAIAMLATHRAV